MGTKLGSSQSKPPGMQTPQARRYSGYMEFGLTIEKILLIAVIFALIVGPEKLPDYAEKLARFTKQAGGMVKDARSRMRDEMGAEVDELDWRKLDPRQYDPRRIIRDALMDDTPPPPSPATQAPQAPATATEPKAPVHGHVFNGGDLPPYDNEAT